VLLRVVNSNILLNLTPVQSEYKRQFTRQVLCYIVAQYNQSKDEMVNKYRCPCRWKTPRLWGSLARTRLHLEVVGAALVLGGSSLYVSGLADSWYCV